jgi:HlyD family secretion protein
MKTKWNRILTIVVALILIAAAAVALRPRVLEVEIAVVDRGPLAETIREDGKTRIRERYTVSAPLAGNLQRIRWRPGDVIDGNDALLAVIFPADPELLDERERSQAEARVRAAEALQNQLAEQLERARINRDYSTTNLERARKLFATNAGSRQDLDNAEQLELTTGHALKEAEFGVQVAKFELEQARAVLERASPGKDSPGNKGHEIHSPVCGSILRVFQESAGVVASGTKLLEIGDPTDLEIEVDVLSTDAVRVRPGAKVRIEHWGGGEPLDGRVRVVEPSAFTKISALGVEEQRVNIIIDFVSPREKIAALGDGFRVEAHIVTWESPEVIRVPAGALFRDGDGWSVFVVKDGFAVKRRLDAGHVADEHAEVPGGLEAGESVILYPSDSIGDGDRVRIRRR